jgi:hypothetical protein
MSIWRPHVPLEPNHGDKVDAYSATVHIAKFRFVYHNDGWYLSVLPIALTMLPHEWTDESRVWADSFELKQWIASDDVQLFPTLRAATGHAVEQAMRRIAKYQYQIGEELTKLLDLHNAVEPREAP